MTCGSRCARRTCPPRASSAPRSHPAHRGKVTSRPSASPARRWQTSRSRRCRPSTWMAASNISSTIRTAASSRPPRASFRSSIYRRSSSSTRTAGSRWRTTSAPDSRACAACSIRPADSSTGRASGTPMVTRDWRNNWGTTYAGHFFLEAEKAGYTLPGDMKSSWLRYQKRCRAALESAPGRTGPLCARPRPCRALCAGLSPVHAGARRSARDRRDEPPARKLLAVAGGTLAARLDVQARRQT